MDFEDIIDSFFNGQIKQCSKQIKEYGEKKFLYDLQDNYLVSDKDKLDLLFRVYRSRL